MLPPGWHDVVRRHPRRTQGWVLAQSGPCLATRDLEASGEYVSGRLFQALAPADVEGLKIPASWFLGVLVCPGDELVALSDWAAQLPKPNLHHIRFYVHDEADLVAVFKPWYAAGLPTPDTEPLVVGERFHKKFGRDHGNQVVRDAAAFGW